MSSYLYEIIGLMQQSEREYYKYANELASEEEDEYHYVDVQNEQREEEQRIAEEYSEVQRLCEQHDEAGKEIV